MHRTFVIISAATFALGCAAAPQQIPLGPPVPAPTPAELTGEEPAAKPKNADFVNHGGLFMPDQMPSQAETLKSLGLAIDPALLADPLSELLSSIVNVSGCS